MSSLQDFVLVVARKATATTEIQDTQSLVQKSSLQELDPLLTRNFKTSKERRGHTTIGTKVVVARNNFCFRFWQEWRGLRWREGTHKDWVQKSSLQELVFVLARKATTATERRNT
jgi:hypothetical protein